MDNLPVPDSRVTSHPHRERSDLLPRIRRADDDNRALVSRFKAATLVRTVVATVYFVSVQLQYIAGRPSYQLIGQESHIKWFTVVVYGYSVLLLIAAYLLRRARFLPKLVLLQLALDSTAILFYALFTGGSGSFYTVFLYALVFYSASMMERKWFFSTIGLTGGAYLILVLSDLHLLPLARLFASTLVQIPAEEVYSNIMINASAFVGVSVLSNYYARFVSRIEDERVSFQKLKKVHEHLVEVMPTGLIAIDLRQRITLINGYAKALMGVGEDTVVGLPIGRYFRSIKPILDNEDKLAMGVSEITHERLRDREVRLRWNLSVLTTDEGERIGYLLLFEDVTAMYRLEKKTKKMQEFALIGRLAAGIVHEIRNPLASISGAVQVLSQLESLPKDEQNLTRIILREVDHLSQWTNEFLSYARPKQPEREEVDLAQVVDDVITLLSHEPSKAGDSLEITADLQRPVMVWVDPNQMGQVIRNIFANARDAMPEGGHIKALLRKEPERAVLRVIDDGPGVAWEDIDHLFEPFFTTKEAGTGLGLSIVQRAVEAHGGIIRLDSTIGVGTQVEISLPLGKVALSSGVYERPRGLI